MAISVGVVGAAGYAGIEAVRLVLRHPHFELVAATSNELAGTRIDALYPAFRGITDLEFVPHGDSSIDECDVVFLAVPHTAAMKVAPELMEHKATVIDLSADFRIKDVATYEQWYKVKHTAPELIAQAAFGLPELFGDQLEEAAVKRVAGEAVLVSCPGCYPTATSLAAAPALRNGLISDDGLIVADAISGVSGAGRTANARTHFCSANENVEAYGVGSHRHTPEIEQILNIPNRLVFTPHLAPYNRGLLSTVTLPLGDVDIDQAQLDVLYKNFYRDDKFVQVLVGGAQPKTSSVAGTNYAHVAAVFNRRTQSIIATCAIDNIGKGAAGQAVQCANIVCGLDETCGLDNIAVTA